MQHMPTYYHRSGLADWRDPANKIPGDDTLHIADRFTAFLDDRVKDSRPWLAHLCITRSTNRTQPCRCTTTCTRMTPTTSAR